MPVCPNCNNEHRRRKYGACPTCGEEIRLYEGKWYLAGSGSPNVQVLEYFEQLVSQRETAEMHKTCIFRIPRKGGMYTQELVAAGRLLDVADNDVHLTKNALWHIFYNRRFSWKIYTSLMYLYKDFLLALAIARANKEKTEEQVAQEIEAIEKLHSRENIFAD